MRLTVNAEAIRQINIRQSSEWWLIWARVVNYAKNGR